MLPSHPRAPIPARLRAPLRVCSIRGCTTRVTRGKCAECARTQDRDRGTAHARGYTKEWAKARLAYLHQHPLCVHCFEQQKLTPANVVDHVIPHRGDMRLFWDESNWAALCASCHSAKTVREDGGFGER